MTRRDRPNRHARHAPAQGARRAAAISFALAPWLFALGCQVAGPPTAAAAFPLGGAAWRVDEIDGQRVQGSDSPTLSFDGAQRVSGSSGCNRYTAALTVAGSDLRVGDVAMTRMACPPPVMELERRFVAALTAVRGHRLVGETLELLDESGRVRLRLGRS